MINPYAWLDQFLTSFGVIPLPAILVAVTVAKILTIVLPLMGGVACTLKFG